MGVLDKIFGGTKEKAESAIEVPPCPHTALIPRWDSVDDIGHEDRATRYVCEACGETFSPQRARELRETEAERLPSPVEQATE